MTKHVVTAKLPLTVHVTATTYCGADKERTLYDWSVALFDRELIGNKSHYFVSEEAALRDAKRQIRDFAERAIEQGKSS